MMISFLLISPSFHLSGFLQLISTTHLRHQVDNFWLTHNTSLGLFLYRTCTASTQLTPFRPVSVTGPPGSSQAYLLAIHDLTTCCRKLIELRLPSRPAFILTLPTTSRGYPLITSFHHKLTWICPLFPSSDQYPSLICCPFCAFT